MGYRKPIEIKLQLTEKCNYDCSFCFNKQLISTTGKRMAANKAKKIISAVADEGIEGIRFTGGEPLLHNSMVELLSFAKRKGLRTTLNTNASLISRQKAKSVGKRADIILVSMHSLQPNAKAIAAIKLLSKQGCSIRPATILTRENIQNLEKFHEMVLSLPFGQWVLLRQIANTQDKEPVSSQDMQKAIEKIASFNAKRKKADWFLIENALPFCCCNPERTSKVALGGIHEDGHSSLFVSADATIRPSYFFDIALGNALTDSFLDAWRSPFMLRMNRLEFIADSCHKCKYVLKCMSGSRFSALLANNSLYSLDPLAKPLDFLQKLNRNK